MARKIAFVGADAAYLLKFRGELMARFRDRGDTVIAITPSLGGVGASDFEGEGFGFREWPVAKAGLNPLGAWRSWRALERLIAEAAPDILFAHTIKPVIMGMIAAKRAGVPRRVALIPGLGYAFMPPRSLKQLVVQGAAIAGYRAALKQADVVIFQNPDDRSEFNVRGLLPKTLKVGLVNGSGVDMEAFAQEDFPPGPPVFLMIARLLRDKGVFEFVEAARLVKQHCPEARFELVGGVDPNPESVTESDVARWEAEGVINGRGQLDDVKPALAACHVFVLPSYREGTPRTNLEAMASSRAVITTDAPGCRETVVHGTTGLIVPPRDARALADAMLQLANDLPRAKAMGEAGRRYCSERFELHKVVSETAALIEG